MLPAWQQPHFVISDGKEETRMGLKSLTGSPRELCQLLQVFNSLPRLRLQPGPGDGAPEISPAEQRDRGALHQLHGAVPAPSKVALGQLPQRDGARRCHGQGHPEGAACHSPGLGQKPGFLGAFREVQQQCGAPSGPAEMEEATGQAGSICIFKRLNAILAPPRLFLSWQKHNRRTRPEKGQGTSPKCGAEAKIKPRLGTASRRSRRGCGWARAGG